MSTIYSSFRQNGIKVNNLGVVLGSGTQSIAIEPMEEFLHSGLLLEKPIIIATLEKEKKSFLKKIYGKKVLQEIEPEYLSLFAETTIMQLKENGMELFYVEKMQKTILEKEISEVLTDFSREYWDETFNARENFSWIIQEMTMNLLSKKSALSTQDEMIFSSIKSALMAVKECKFSEKFKIDLHSDQFLTHKGKIYCNDPVLFNYNYFAGNYYDN